MLKLLHSDLHRLVRGKMFWVVILVLAGWVCLSAYLTRLAIDALGSDVIGDVDSRLVDMATGMLSQNIELTSQFGEMLIAGGGILVMLVSIFAALFAATDLDTGYIKNIFPARRGRLGYYLEKFLLIALYCLLLVAVGALVLYAAMRAVGFGFSQFVWPSVLRWFGVVWFLLCGYAFVSAGLAWLSRSKALGCVFAVLLGTSALGGIIMGIVLMLPTSDVSEALEAALEWLPFRTLAAVGPGVIAFDPNGVIVPTGLSMLVGGFEEPTTGALWPGTDIPTIVHVCITAGAMWAISIIATLLVCMRRDV